jgi:hypothetical protein
MATQLFRPLFEFRDLFGRQFIPDLITHSLEDFAALLEGQPAKSLQNFCCTHCPGFILLIPDLQSATWHDPARNPQENPPD